MNFTKTELQKKTKAELTSLAKSKFKLKIAASATKDRIITALQKAQKAVGKKRVTKKPALKKGAKKTTTKKSIKKKGAKAKKKSAKKVTAKTKTKTSGSAEGITGKVGVTDKARKAKKGPAKLWPIDSKEDKAGSKQPDDIPLHRPELPGDVIVSESKYHVAEVSRESDFIDGLPASYEDNRVILLVRDPFWIFVSWDLEKGFPARTAEQQGINLQRGRIVLRAYDVTDIDFNGNNAHSYFDVGPNSVMGNWYIEVPRDDASYIVEIGLRDEFGNFHMMTRSNAVTTPRATASNRFDEEWMMADDDFWKIYRLSGGFKSGGSSENLAGEMSRHLMHSVSSGGASSDASLDASSGSESVFRKTDADDFSFNLDCELVVHGKARPDAKVTIKGKDIKLNNDGTFTERFILPDGIQVLDASAKSADRKHEITITPTISRSTASFIEGERR